MLSSSPWACRTNPPLELLLWVEIIFRCTQTPSPSKKTSPPPPLASRFTAAGRSLLQLHSSFRSEGKVKDFMLSVCHCPSSFYSQWDEVICSWSWTALGQECGMKWKKWFKRPRTCKDKDKKAVITNLIVQRAAKPNSPEKHERLCSKIIESTTSRLHVAHLYLLNLQVMGNYLQSAKTKCLKMENVVAVRPRRAPLRYLSYCPQINPS